MPRFLIFIIAKELRPYVTKKVLEEYARVFDYERLEHLDRRRVARLSDFLTRAAVKVKSRGWLSAQWPPKPITF